MSTFLLTPWCSQPMGDVPTHHRLHRWLHRMNSTGPQTSSTKTFRAMGAITQGKGSAKTGQSSLTGQGCFGIHKSGGLHKFWMDGLSETPSELVQAGPVARTPGCQAWLQNPHDPSCCLSPSCLLLAAPIPPHSVILNEEHHPSSS